MIIFICENLYETFVKKKECMSIIVTLTLSLIYWTWNQCEQNFLFWVFSWIQLVEEMETKSWLWREEEDGRKETRRKQQWYEQVFVTLNFCSYFWAQGQDFDVASNEP